MLACALSLLKGKQRHLIESKLTLKSSILICGQWGHGHTLSLRADSPPNLPPLPPGQAQEQGGLPPRIPTRPTRTGSQAWDSDLGKVIFSTNYSIIQTHKHSEVISERPHCDLISY